MRKNSPKAKPASPPGFPGATGWKLFSAGAVLFLFSILLYWPSFSAGFIWDDNLIAGNPLIRNGLPGLRDIWFSIKFGDFVPVTATSFWLEWQLFHAGTVMMHGTNILVQALNVVLLWLVLRDLRIPGAWLAAAIFAAHPVCVTSVTWLAERKNTLSFLFYLLSLLFFLRSDSFAKRRSSLIYYWLSFVLFLMALLSKSSVVVLPVVFLLCAWGKQGRIGRRDLWRASPFFLFAFAAGLVTVTAHYYFAPKMGLPSVTDSLLVRFLAGTRAFWFYLAKDFLPVNLTMHYPRWEIDPASPLAYFPALALGGLFLIFWRFRRTWGKACLYGVGYFLLALAPALGLFKMAYLQLSQVADHFQYLALPGLIALCTAAFCCHPSSSILLRRFGSCFAVLLVAVLSILTWQRQAIIGHAEALWRDNLTKNPHSWPALNNLGEIFLDQGKFKEAEGWYHAALAINPNSSEVHFNLGNAFLAQTNLDQAIAEFSEAARLAPTWSKAQNNLGIALYQKGRSEEALVHFQAAVGLDPDNMEAHSSLAWLLGMQGRRTEAREQYVQALRLAPDHANLHAALGQLLALENELDPALAQFQEALRLAPGTALVHYQLAHVLFQKGDLAGAKGHYQTALQLQPDFPEAHDELARLLAKLPSPGNTPAATHN